MKPIPLTPSLSQNGRGKRTISITLQKVGKELQHSSDAPALDAERILLHVLKERDASYLIAHSEDILTKDQVAEVTNMQHKRTTGMPLAYILGEADFYGRTFTVTPDVLIPRPDTEALIDKALEYINTRHPELAAPREARERSGDSGSRHRRPGFRIESGMTEQKEFVIADICTGSGIIAITLALELYNLQPTTYRLIATDISEKALNIAKQNAEKHGVLDQIEFIQGDMFKALESSPPPYEGGARGGSSRKIDLIVSNPPYVPAEALAKAGRAINTRGLLFEPSIALDGGEDGLTFVRTIQEYSQKHSIPAIIETVGGRVQKFDIY